MDPPFGEEPEPEREHTATVVTLRQIMSDSGGAMRDLIRADIGDVVCGFEVVDVDDVRCPHPKRRYRVDSQVTQEEPEVRGTCTVCGHKARYELEEVPETIQNNGN